MFKFYYTIYERNKNSKFADLFYSNFFLKIIQINQDADDGLEGAGLEACWLVGVDAVNWLVFFLIKNKYKCIIYLPSWS